MKQRILVVEDESDLRNLIAQILTSYGCDVKTARTANEARLLLTREKFSDLLTDVNLPDMNGLDFVSTLYNIRPERVWIMSGHVASEDPRLDHVKATGFISKPFRASTLKMILREAA